MSLATPTQQKNTPLMDQYFSIKEQYPDALLFFQVGDFYELFFDDAKQAASFLALTLTKRGKNKGEDIPLCGVPLHAASHYLTKLIKGGFKVVVCDQLEKPQPGSVVKRGVSQVFTPGTLLDDQMLDQKSASYLLTITPTHDSWGIISSELLTAQLFATNVPLGAFKMLETELTRFCPDEIILPHSHEQSPLTKTLKSFGYPISFSHAIEAEEVASAWVEQQFNSLTKNTLTTHSAIHQSLITLYWYLKKNQTNSLPLFKNINFYAPEDYLILDAATQKNLELLSDATGSRKHSLLAVLDQAATSMGSRTIKKWLQRPLVQIESIYQRQEVIKEFVAQPRTLMQFQELLKQSSDLERITGRISLDKSTIRDYQALKTSLTIAPAIKKIFTEKITTPLAKLLSDKISDFTALEALLEASINDDPLQPDLIVKKGFHLELDSMRHLAQNAEQEILALEQRLISETNISSLKIRFNNITGYFIEITNANESMIPASYRHVQTLANRKRFTNDELTRLEKNITKAQHESNSLEQEVFKHIKQEVYSYLSPLRNLAQAIAYSDALSGLAKAAYDNHYTQPMFNENHCIDLTASRHPVIELELGNAFVKNNVQINDQARLIILTGPNMGGKSTYLRQVALTAIMAQIGSFIPAAAGTLPIFDRIFTRIGSGDNLAHGKSTFFIEMEETATICTQATKNSLVILDEVGRGTSTYDGMAIAQAVVEFLARKTKVSCLFATHYHELTTLEETDLSIKNYYAECTEQNKDIVFTHRIRPGKSLQSLGIHVAKLALLPEQVTSRAQEILNEFLSHDKHQREVERSPYTPIVEKNDCSIAHIEGMKIITLLSNLDIETLSPKAAFDLIWKLKKDFKMQ